jgi:hypothetical protein
MLLSKADVSAIVALVSSNIEYPPFVDNQKFEKWLAKNIEKSSEFYEDILSIEGAFFGVRGTMRHLPESCNINVWKAKGEWVFSYSDQETVVRR